MLRTLPTILLCSLVLLAETRAQDVMVPRQLRKLPVIKPDVEQPAEEPVKSLPEKEPVEAGKDEPSRSEPVKTAVREPEVEVHPVKRQPAKVAAKDEAVATSQPEKSRSAKVETVTLQVAKEPANPSVPAKGPEPARALATKESSSNSQNEKARSMKGETTTASVKKEAAGTLPAAPAQSVKLEPARVPPVLAPTVNVQLSSDEMETASTKLADGFDFPVGKPDAEGYYRARGFRSGGHMGEDWDGVRGGDTDLRDPIYSIGDGIVVFSRDVHLGWGNVVIVRHAYRENGMVKHIDALYGHLHSILVKRGQKVARGQQIGSMGTAHGQYDAHLHLEIRKNLEIGMSKSKFQKNLTNYHDPSQFIASHRRLPGGGATFRVAMNTFTHDGAYHFDRAPNFSARKRSTLESSAALRRAISSTTAASRD